MKIAEITNRYTISKMVARADSETPITAHVFPAFRLLIDEAEKRLGFSLTNCRSFDARDNAIIPKIKPIKLHITMDIIPNTKTAIELGVFSDEE